MIGTRKKMKKQQQLTSTSTFDTETYLLIIEKKKA